MQLGDLTSKLRRSLSLREAIGLVAAVSAATAFLEVMEEVIQGRATPFDRSVSLSLHRFASPVVDDAMRGLTRLGSGWFLFVIVIGVAGWALHRRAHALAGVFVAVALAAEGLNVLLKLLLRRARPDLWELVLPNSYSFPSGHAMVSTAVYGMAAFVAGRLQPRLRWPLYVGMPLVVLVIGISRVYLGVHWPTDVLAGFAAGGLILLGGRLALGHRRLRTE
jgi:membrane-associated phospholipid phosphatase